MILDSTTDIYICTHVELIIVVSNQQALGVAMGVAAILVGVVSACGNQLYSLR